MGCDHWEYAFGTAYGDEIKRPGHDIVNCNHPRAWGWIAAVYMVSFIVLGALVLLTLFIGVVSTSMEMAKGEQREEAKQEEAIGKTGKALNMMQALLQQLHPSLRHHRRLPPHHQYQNRLLQRLPLSYWQLYWQFRG